MDNVKICAVKASAKIPDTDLACVQRFCKQNGIRYKIFNRSHLVVYDRYTFCIFKKSPNSFNDQHVNITKLQNTNNIISAVEDLAWLIDTEPKNIFCSVDNITATGNLEKNIDLEEFLHVNSDLKDFISYQPERFPGLFIRSRNGKIIVFKSGKMVFVGCKKAHQIEDLNKYMLQKCALM